MFIPDLPGSICSGKRLNSDWLHFSLVIDAESEHSAKGVLVATAGRLSVLPYLDLCDISMSLDAADFSVLPSGTQ